MENGKALRPDRGVRITTPRSQVATQIGDVYDVPMPDEVARLLSAFKLLNVELAALPLQAAHASGLLACVRACLLGYKVRRLVRVFGLRLLVGWFAGRWVCLVC